MGYYSIFGKKKRKFYLARNHRRISIFWDKILVRVKRKLLLHLYTLMTHKTLLNPSQFQTLRHHQEFSDISGTFIETGAKFEN